MARRVSPWIVRPLMGIVWIAGNLSPVWLFWLLWPRREPALAPHADLAGALWFDFGLALIFPAQHSIWTQPPVKRALQRLFGENLERPMYSIASALAIVATCAPWRCTDRAIWEAPDLAIHAMRGGMLACLGVMTWCSSILGPSHLIGLAHLRAMERGEPLRPTEFRLAGPYRLVRHPIAASQVVMLWMTGTLFADRLLLCVTWTAWIVGVTALEDRRLAREFGETYRAYRERAGFMLPRLRRPATDPAD